MVQKLKYPETVFKREAGDKITCGACGQIGHSSRSKNCPKHSKFKRDLTERSAGEAEFEAWFEEAEMLEEGESDGDFIGSDEERALDEDEESDEETDDSEEEV